MIALYLYLGASVILMIFLMGKSRHIGKIWEWEEFKSNIPVGAKLVEMFFSLFIVIPYFIIVTALVYYNKRHGRSK